MNLQISCQVAGNTEYIELFGTDALTMDLSFAEIQDITKKNSAYTKELNVPGTNNNNYIFNYFFDLNQVPLDFTPTKKFEAQILYNGYIIQSGYIRLNTVTIEREKKVYNITFYNGIGDVAATIGDKFMRQLDLTHLDHPFSNDVIYQSTLDYNLFPLTGTTNYSYQNGKTYWPLLNIGYNYTESLSGISSYYVSTSSSNIQINGGVKTIVTAVALPFVVGDTIRYTDTGTGHYIQGVVTSVVGQTIQFQPNVGLGSGSINSGTVSRQLVEGQQITDPRTTPLLLFADKPTIPNYMSFSGTPIRSFYAKPSIQVSELYEQIFLQSGYMIESEFLNSSYFDRFYLPLKFLDETIYTKGAIIPCYTFSGACGGYPCLATTNIGGFEYSNQVTATTCNNVPFSATSTGFTITSAYTGQYTFQITATFTLEPDGSSGAFFNTGVGLNGVQFGIGNASAPATPAGVFSYTSSWQQQFDITGQTEVSLWFDFGPSNNSYLTSYRFDILIAPGVIIGNFDYSKEFPENDFKQIDFITGINKYFNLVCVPHTTKPKTIVVEPMIDYVGKGRTLDWTDKIDWDSPITISPVTNIFNGTLNYNFKLDQDYINQQFNIANNRVFGTYQLQLSQDYKDNNINFDTIFGSPTDVDINNTNLPGLTAPSMATIKTEDRNGTSIQRFNPYKILPRLMFRGVTLPNENYMVPASGGTQNYWIETASFDRWSLNNRFTTYPFSYTGFSHYINFNAENTYSTRQEIFPDQQDMYDIYYYDYVSDLLAPENKIMNAKVYLTPYEIADLKFNEKIIIRNAYWRINKINGYNLTEPSLCNVEFIKLTKDYTPHPVKYYDLINCNTGGTDYHSTSDMNYNLYAYIGKYVKIFTGSTTAYTSIGCFQVVEGTPDVNFDYNPVFIGSGYTQSGVAVYDDCNCTGKTSFDIVQQNY